MDKKEFFALMEEHILKMEAKNEKKNEKINEKKNEKKIINKDDSF